LEKTFIRNGFKVLEVRQLPKLEIEQNVNASSDFLVFVQSFGDEDKLIGGGEITKQAKFFYGTDATAISQEMTAEEIDEVVGEKMSMSPVVQETKKIIEAGRSKDDLVQRENCIFLDVKVVDVDTREVVLFYKSYTFSDAVKTSSEKTIKEYSEDTTKFIYDKKEKRFIAHNEVKKADRKSKKSAKKASEEPGGSPYYGDLSRTESKEGDDVSVPTSDRLRRLAKACNSFIDTIKNYQIEKSDQLEAQERSRQANSSYQANAYIDAATAPVKVLVLEETDTHYKIKIESTGKTGNLPKSKVRLEKLETL
jgi:hypothetical protein